MDEIITGKEVLQRVKFFELAPNKVTRGRKYTLLKKPKETLGQKSFRARVVDLWLGFDDSTVTEDSVTSFKRKQGKLSFWKHSIVICSGFKTNCSPSEPFKTLVMLCYDPLSRVRSK